MSPIILQLRLSPADRDRYNLTQEWLDLDVLAVTAREAMLMQVGADLGDGMIVQFDSPSQWRIALNGDPVLGSDGQPVTEDVTADDGTVTSTPKRRPNFGAEIATVWLALRRAGVTVGLADVDFDRDAFEWRLISGDEPGGEPGKDDGSTPPTTSPI